MRSRNLLFILTVLAFSALLSNCSFNETLLIPATSTSVPNDVVGLEPSPSISPPESTPEPEVEPELFQPLSFSAPDCGYGGAFKSIEALDRYSVRFTLCAPDPAFLTKIALPPFAIQPDEWLVATGGGGELLENPVGTGPYRLDEWKRGQEIVFSAFDQYWGEPKPGLSPLIFRWDTDSQHRLLQVMAGMVDGVDHVGPEYFDQVISDGTLNLVIRPAMNVAYLGINNTVPPLDQEGVRRAIAMAIDRERVVAMDFPAGFQVADYFTPCAIPYACEGEPWHEYDPAAARDLLNQAGFSLGFRLELFYRGESYGYLPWPDRVAAEISRQLRINLGLDIHPTLVDSDVLLAAIDSGQVPGLYLLGWGADFPDVSNFLDLHFGFQAPDAFGIKFPDIVEALQHAAAAQGDDRKSHYAAANAAIKAHVPAIPLAHGGWDSQESMAAAFKNGVQGAHGGFFGNETFNRLANPGHQGFVWIQPAEPASLYCADEIDQQSWQACTQVTETLYRFEPGGAAPLPHLAEQCTPDGTLTVWTCSLQQGVSFHDGSILDAADVVASFVIQWDAVHPLHKGNSGSFTYFKFIWGNFLNGS